MTKHIIEPAAGTIIPHNQGWLYYNRKTMFKKFGREAGNFLIGLRNPRKRQGRRVKGNNTPFPCFNDIARDERVRSVWFEGDDGFWADLKPGYTWEGCTSVHEWSLRAMRDSLSIVEKV